MGFPPGVAEKLVLNSMYKWKNASSSLKETIPNLVSNSISESNKFTAAQNDNCRLSPPVAQEIEINSCNESDNTFLPEESFKTDYTSDSYNGAIRENYVWTQTLDDLDVLIKIPEHIKTPKQTKVNISSDEIKIDVKRFDSTKDSEWDNIFNGKLSFKVRRDESIWSIVSGKHISVRLQQIRQLNWNIIQHVSNLQYVIIHLHLQIHFEKATGRWWEALVIDEPKIELNKIDCTKRFDDMAQEEQMKMHELMWNHRQKMLGKPTSEQFVRFVNYKLL